MAYLVLNRVFFLFVLLTGTVRADLYDDYINSVSKKPFVSFLARTSDGSSGKPGHAYVALGVELANGLRVYERVFGFYPKNETAIDEIKAIFSKVSGDIAYKFKDLTWSVEYQVPITESQHQAVLVVIQKWKVNTPEYSLTASGGKNCSSFMAEVAKSIGLNAPDGAGSMLPLNYIKKLKDAN